MGISLEEFGPYLLFVVPGFISMKVHDLLVPSERRNFSNEIIQIVAFSCINLAALSWLIFLGLSDEVYVDARPLYFVTLFVVLFVAPVLWPFAVLKLRETKWVSRFIVHPLSHAWDYVFNERKGKWVIVHMKDGRRVGGLYGLNSFASSHPAAPEVFVEEVWTLDSDGGFIGKVESTQGMLILSDEILAIEFFE